MGKRANFHTLICSLYQKMNFFPWQELTSSVTMISGYLSSDRKLKMHQILNASSLEMRIWLWSKFFLEHNVQHILWKSWRSKLSVACNTEVWQGEQNIRVPNSNRGHQWNHKLARVQSNLRAARLQLKGGFLACKTRNHSSHFNFIFDSVYLSNFMQILDQAKKKEISVLVLKSFLGLNSRGQLWKGLIGAG